MFLSNAYNKKTLLFLIIIIFNLFIIIPHFTKAQSNLKLRYDYKTSIKISLRKKERQAQTTTQVQEEPTQEQQGPKLHLVEIEGDWDSRLDKVIKNIKEKINPNFNGTLTKRKTINRIKDGNISFEITTGTCEPSTICLYHDGEIRGDLDKKYTYQELTKMTGKYTNLYIFYHDIENTKKLDGAKNLLLDGFQDW